MTPAAFRKLALSLAGASEQPHFDRTSFRVGKKIFATMTTDGSEATVMVRPVDRAFALIENYPAAFYGHGGWTRRLGAVGVRLPLADPALLRELVRESWQRIAPAPRKPRRSR